MKDIKSYVIGFLTCACLFLIMGATYNHTGNGRYELTDGATGTYLLDTKTGEVYSDIPKTETKWISHMKFDKD